MQELERGSTPPESFDELLSSGKRALYTESFSEALQLLGKAEILAVDQCRDEDLKTFSLLKISGMTHEAMCNYRRAMSYYQQCLDLLEKLECLSGSTREFKAMNRILGVHIKMNNLSEAEDLLNKCQKLLQKTTEAHDNHKHVSDRLRVALCESSALLCREQAKFDKAIEIVNEALEISKNLSESKDVLKSIRILLIRGQTYTRIIRSKEAQTDISQALQMLESRSDHNTALLSSALNSKAALEMFQGRYPLAKDDISRAVQTIRKVFPNRHLELARSFKTLGLISLDEKNIVQATKSLKASYSIYRDILGEDHPYTVSTLSNLGMLYCEKADFLLAERTFNETLVLRRRTLGGQHPEVAESLHRLAEVYQEQGKFESSLDYLRKAEKIYQEVYKSDHLDLAAVNESIGLVYIKSRSNEDSQALDYFNKALVTKVNLFGEEHPSIAITYSNIGTAHGELGDLDNKLVFYKKALTIQKKIFGKNQNELMVTYYNLGTAYADMDYTDKALKKHQKALSMKRRIYGDNHPSVGDSYYAIGMLYPEGNDRLYTNYHMKALKIRIKHYGHCHEDVAASCISLAHMYDQIMDYRLATSYTQRAAMARCEHLKKSNADWQGDFELFEMSIKAIEIEEELDVLKQQD